MRLLLASLFLILSLTSFAQDKLDEYIDVSFCLPWKNVVITLLKESTLIYSSTSDSSTIMVYQDLEPGFYKLLITDFANNSEYRDSIWVNSRQKITADIRLESICPYNYPKDYIPNCPANHKDGLLEIRYRSERERIKGKKYFLVPYIASGCVERFYCTRHNLKF